MERLLICFYAYELFNLLRLHVIEADAIFSHQLNTPRSSASVIRQCLADNRSPQNPVNLERDTFSDWSMQGFVVWN